MKHKLSKKALAYRPQSYWEHSNPLDEILAGISGQNRRRLIRNLWNEGKLDEIHDELLKDELTVDVRGALDSIHPSWMGGEYLPAKLAGTAVIATISLRSTLSDVIELRAQAREDGGIEVKWVDEYEGEFEQPTDCIEKPFTLQELIKFIEGTSTESGYLPLCYNKYLCKCGSDIAEVREFTSLDSEFYPELRTWFRAEASVWAAGREMSE